MQGSGFEPRILRFSTIKLCELYPLDYLTKKKNNIKTWSQQCYHQIKNKLDSNNVFFLTKVSIEYLIIMTLWFIDVLVFISIINWNFSIVDWHDWWFSGNLYYIHLHYFFFKVHMASSNFSSHLMHFHQPIKIDHDSFIFYLPIKMNHDSFIFH